MRHNFTRRWRQAAAVALKNAEADWLYTEQLSERWLGLLLALADEWQQDRAVWLEIWPDDLSELNKLPKYLPVIAGSCVWFAKLSVPIDQQRPWHAAVLKGLMLYLIWQWQQDETPDLSKTMAAMDRSLKWLEKLQINFI